MPRCSNTELLWQENHRSLCSFRKQTWHNKPDHHSEIVIQEIIIQEFVISWPNLQLLIKDDEYSFDATNNHHNILSMLEKSLRELLIFHVLQDGFVIKYKD